MYRFFINLFLLLAPIFCWAIKSPAISQEDTKKLSIEMLEAHASEKKLTEKLLLRVLPSFLDQIDPLKCYLLEEEISSFLHPTEEDLSRIKQEILHANFSSFNQIFSTYIKSVKRRQELEENLEKLTLKDPLTSEDCKDMQWTATEEQLQHRVWSIHQLQTSSTALLDPPLRDKALERIKKRQKNREDELIQLTEEEKTHQLMVFFLKAFANSLDTHSAYFTPFEAKQFMIQVQQRLFGIGAKLCDDLNGFTVMEIIKNGPASKNSALKENDRIIAIDSEPIVGLEINDAVELIRGPDQSKVMLTVVRKINGEEKKIDIEIIRGEVVIEEARLQSKLIPFGTGVIAHISLHAFYQDPSHSSAADLQELITKIQSENNLKGLVLDLRDNSGGILPQAVAVAGLFITKGVVVSVKDNWGHIDYLRSINGQMAYDGPLIILTSRQSASASEIVAQTLQDYGRAICVGDDHTFGKGSFQTFSYDALKGEAVNPKGEFKVTRGYYYTVSGKSPQLIGVIPDLIVPGPLSALEIGEQYMKYPLPTDHIPEKFHDDLSDIEPRQRHKIGWLYQLNLQTKLSTYTQHLPLLSKNSQLRLKNDLSYERLKKEIAKEKPDLAYMQTAQEADLQLKEAVAIMQDLILLLD